MTASESQSYSADPETAPGITFDRFVRACVVLRQVTKAFNALDSDRDGWININYLQFLKTFLWLPWTDYES
jgi:Ca2+-binding EF-hand superfamily protein